MFGADKARKSVYGGAGARESVFIANAREGEVIERVDEEKIEKYNNIIELLLAGGYFRARIQGLTPFDKVVGGMAWSITSSNVDVDVDLFFQENATIGQRIKLSEKIIEALTKLKCPFPLQAQQIQGEEYIYLFPVIQWLVAKVIETREETGDLSRIYSESQFGKSFTTPQDRDFLTRKPLAMDFVGEVEDRYKPERRFKRQKNTAPTVQATLLEYGKLHRAATKDVVETVKKPASAIANKLNTALGGSKAAPKDDDDAEKEEQLINSVMKSLEGVRAEDGVKGIGSFLDASDIESAQANYTPQQAEDAVLTGEGQKLMSQKLHKQQIANLERQIISQKDVLAKVEAVLEEMKDKEDEIEEQYNQRLAFNQRIITETAKLDSLETPQNTKQLQLLRGLVGLNESLRLQEQLYKANCKKQMIAWKELIESLKKSTGGDDETEVERRQLVEETFGTDSEKLKKIKQLLSKKNRDISLVERKIDDVPARTELMQYQRQFVELYEQVSSKLTETRQYYISYNTLEDTRSVLAREVSILNSIHDNYKTAMASKASREKLLESMENIVKGVFGNLEKEEGKFAREKKTSDELNERYMGLVEKERKYYKSTREFQEECKKNELLLAKLNES